AQSIVIKRELLLESRDAESVAMTNIYLREARRLFEEAGAETLPDPMVRLSFAQVLYDLAIHRDAAVNPSEQGTLAPRAIRILEGLTRPAIPPPVRARAWATLAQLYGDLDHTSDVSRAYGEALKLETDNRERSRLLANRAEAYMLQGDLSTAIDGYRAALASL